MRTCWRPTPQRLLARLPACQELKLTYAEVGATGAGELPAGYHHIDQTTVLGDGRRRFDAVADGLAHWRLQRAAGLLTAASSPTAITGATVVSATSGPVGLLVPCRVVAVVEEIDRRGFAYGTLPGHPLSGEERFTVELSSGRVSLRIVSFSRPTGVARLMPALVRAGQRAVNVRYAAAARRLATGNA